MRVVHDVLVRPAFYNPSQMLAKTFHPKTLINVFWGLQTKGRGKGKLLHNSFLPLLWDIQKIYSKWYR